MAFAPKRPCAEPRCPALVRSGRCEQHARGQGRAHGWATAHGRNVERLRGRALQRARAALFAQEPLCRQCREHGRVTIATIRDHVVPLAQGGTDAPENLAPICAACHQAKTAAETRRGQERHR
jgi:5-methylcytosine-specific restriction enzyme A